MKGDNGFEKFEFRYKKNPTTKNVSDFRKGNGVLTTR